MAGLRAGVIWVLVCALLVAPCGAAAPLEKVRIMVVVDGALLPIAHAHVTLESDSRTYDGFADSQGVVVLTVAFPDNYHLTVDHPDYRFGAPLAFEALGAPQSFRVVGTSSRLSTIAVVASSARARATSGADTSGAAPEIAGGVGPALGSLPFLDLGGNGSLTINSHDSSTTTATIDGAPVFPSGSKLQLGLFNTDAFASASVQPESIAGAPDGTLALNSYDPTIDWVGIAQQRGASYGSTSSVGERGTAGRLGLAFQHSNSVDDGTLGNAYYSDQSGQFYQHSDASSNESDTLTMRYPLAINDAVYFNAGRIDYARTLACTAFTAALPCGYGPGNDYHQSIDYAQVRDDLSLDRETLTVRAFGSQLDDNYDAAAATFFGTASGYTTLTKTHRTGYSATLGVLVGSREVKIDASSATDASVVRGSFENPAQPLPPSSFEVSSLRVAFPLIDGRRWRADASVGDTAAGLQHQANWGVSESYRLNATDVFAVASRFEDLGSAVYSASDVSNPADLTFDCGGSRAVGFGPTFGATTTPTSSSTAFSFDHTGSRVSIGAQVSRDMDRNGLVYAVVPATALGSGLITLPYLSATNQNAALACGGTLSIEPSSLFFNVGSSASQVITQRASLSAGVNAGERLRLDATFAYAQSRAYGLPAALLASNITPGKPLPYIPAFQASVSVKYGLSRTTTALLSWNAASATSGSGGLESPALSQVSAGLRFDARSGDVVVGLSNIGAARTDGLSRFAPFPYLQALAPPPSLSVSYRLALGKDDIDHVSALSAPIQNSPTELVFSPQSFGPMPRGGWLSVATDSPFCGPELVDSAKADLADIESYRADLAAALKAGSTSFPARTVDGLTLSYIAGPSGYEIRIVPPKSFKQVGPLFRCSLLHMDTYAATSALRLYMPSWDERNNGGFVIFYAPNAGLYFAPDGQDQTSIPVAASTAFPMKTPIEALAVLPTCPSTYTAAVTDMLNELRTYVRDFYAGRNPRVPTDIRIAHHNAKTEQWLEIVADDRNLNEALVTCLGIPYVDRAKLLKLGVDGGIWPSINYSPSLGLYRRD